MDASKKFMATEILVFNFELFIGVPFQIIRADNSLTLPALIVYATQISIGYDQ